MDTNRFWPMPVLVTVGVVISLLFAMRGSPRKQKTDDPLEQQPFLTIPVPVIIA
jgi:hypothetical protein